MNMWIPHPLILFTLTNKTLYIYLESGYMTKESVESEKRNGVFVCCVFDLTPSHRLSFWKQQILSHSYSWTYEGTISAVASFSFEWSANLVSS